jgi:hypothetical protein
VEVHLNNFKFKIARFVYLLCEASTCFSVEKLPTLERKIINNCVGKEGKSFGLSTGKHSTVESRLMKIIFKSLVCVKRSVLEDVLKGSAIT